ncbi:hypothetical protein [Hymenobacter ruber]
MSVVRYGFFGEDAGQSQFLDAYLPHCGSDALDIAFEPVPYFGKQFGQMNNKVVDRRCTDACKAAFVFGYPLLDWLFIGRDIDSFDLTHYEDKIEELRAKIPDKWQHRTLLLLPVQCIEHWLLYLAQYPSREVLERKPNDQTKQTLYADRTKSHNAIVNELLATIDIDRVAWLLEASVSFRAFHQQVVLYMMTIKS